MTQAQLILAHLQSGKSISPLEALKHYGIMRLGARIWELKRDGHPIKSRIVTNRKRTAHFAEYRLEQ